MSKRYVGFACWLLTALCLYFFENNTGTRAVLACSALLPLLPAVRRGLFGVDEAPAQAADRLRREDTPIILDTDEPGDVSPYQPGDPVNRIHWKLSAKRRQLLIRRDDREPAAEEGQRLSAAPEENERKPGAKRRALLGLIALLPALLGLLLIPEMRLSAQALCNLLFEQSERVNAYVYGRFPVPAEQSAAAAAWLLGAILTALLAITALSGSRLMALLLLAGCAAFQIYFGLALPGWINVGLFLLFALWMLRRPWRKRDLTAVVGGALIVLLAVALIIPGVDADTEAASERARDWLSRMAGQEAGIAQETPASLHETRHTHTQTLEAGAGEARADREYRLETAEEAQLSMPHWVDYLKMILLLLLVAALLALPFLPFWLLGRRRKKALEARKSFESERVNEAVCAVFQQVIAWLEATGNGAGNVPYRDWAASVAAALPEAYAHRFARCAALYEEAAYSDHPLEEAARQEALTLLKETEDTLLPRADWKQKLRLRYGECLWI